MNLEPGGQSGLKIEIWGLLVHKQWEWVRPPRQRMEMEKRRCPRRSPLVYQLLVKSWRREVSREGLWGGREEESQNTKLLACLHMVASLETLVSYSGFFRILRWVDWEAIPGVRKGSGEWDRAVRKLMRSALSSRHRVGENWSSALLVTSGKQCGAHLRVSPPKGWGIFVLHLHLSLAEICSLGC